MMISTNDDGGYRKLLEGIYQKTLVHGERTLLSKFRLAKGSILPRHCHMHEQTGYLLSGRLRFTIGERTQELSVGDSWCIPGNIEHGVEVLEDAEVLELFSPVREDYLPVAD